jgi:beta-glucosidase
MKNLFLLPLLSALLLTANAQKPNSAIVPAHKLDQTGWRERHEKILENVRTSDPKLIMIGNSITHNLDKPDRQILWDRYLKELDAVNMGISGDRTENVIWRLQNGLLEGIDPEVATVLIGTNNTDGNHYLEISTPEELSEGIWKICSIIREKLPETEIVLLGILPYGYKPNHKDELNKATNRIISRFYEKDPKIHYYDLGYLFLNEEGKVKRELMPDYLHPNLEGEKLVFEALAPEISKLMAAKDFLDLKFGMFIHFNMATYKGVQWVEGYPDPSEFAPGVEVIDTDAWADAAAAAGMTYAVLTAKHVGGFCLWDSKYTTYDIMHPDCPYKKDLVAQFIESFTSRGLKVGLYYGWRHPGFDRTKDKKDYKVLPPECDPATHSLQEQIEFQKAQIEELITEYPEVFYVWNDALDPEIMEASEILTFLKGISPGILASANWWDWSKKGTSYADIAVTETRYFPEDNSLVGETCWQLEDQWFWNGETFSKDASAMLELLNKVNSNHANLLLNVGPDLNGNIIEPSLATLKEIGKSIK